MSERMDRARAEAEREVAKRREALWENEGGHLSHSWGEGTTAVNQCDAELCPMWGGDVCLCDRFDLDPNDLPTDGTFTTTWEES